VGITTVMALRIVVGLVSALRAVLIYGEAAELMTRPVLVPRVKHAAPSRLAPGEVQALS
jgi:hypothetical protein